MKEHRKGVLSRITAGVLTATTLFSAVPMTAGAVEVSSMPTATVTTISEAGSFQEKTQEMAFVEGSIPKSKYITVDSGKTGQTMLGIGGAMTESAAYNLSKLSPEKQAEVYEAYYGESGAKYSLTRSSIGSADFSVRSYSYDDSDKADPELTHFSIEKDYDYIIPAVKKIQSYNPDVKFFAAPWGPPAWMKENGKRMGGTATAGISLTNNAIKSKYYESYANYLVKYVQAYAAEGIDVYSLSMQNESQNNPAWECATWSISAAATFIGDYLGPALEKNDIDTKLVIWDWDKGNDTLHRDGFIKYNKGVLSNAKARKYIDGIAFHWYAGDLWHELSGTPMWSEDFYSLDEVKEAFPDIHLYATEACQEKGPWMGSKEPAMRYIHDILSDFEHGTECFIDWNLVLDSKGGPTHDPIDNKCHAPIMLDEKNNICYQPSYYVMKMISRAVQPDTLHIQTNISSDLSALDKTAVVDENGKVTLLIGNTKDKSQTVTIIENSSTLRVTIPAYSLTTISYNKDDVCDHAWDDWKDAQDGTHTRTCKKDNTHIQTQPHDFGEWETVKEATCTEGGVTSRTCQSCGAVETAEGDAPTGHIFRDWVTVKEATCTEKGEKSRTCVGCGIEEKEETGTATGHSWDNGKVTTAPTADKAGVKSYTCTACNTTKTEEIPPLGVCKHQAVTDPAVAATNTTAGKTKGSHCGKCGVVIVKQTAIPAISKVTLYVGVNKTYRLTSAKAAAWSITSGSKYVSLKNGILTVKAAGTVKVKDAKSGAVVTITIKKPTLTVNKAKITLKKGKKATLTATATPKATVKWSSSKTSVASVSAKGVVTAKKKGNCTITAKANGVTKKIKITVK